MIFRVLVPCIHHTLRKFFTGQLLAFDGERDDERIVAVAAGGDDEAGEPSLAEAAEAQGERLVRLLSELRAGAALPAHGADRVCTFCEMRGLCRRDHV